MKVKSFLKQSHTQTPNGKTEQTGAPNQGNPIIRCADYPLPGELEADKILFGARDEIVAGGVFRFTPETQAAEMEVNRTYKAILDGGRNFAALRAACARWVETARKPPAAPVMASLFEGLKK